MPESHDLPTREEAIERLREMTFHHGGAYPPGAAAKKQARAALRREQAPRSRAAADLDEACGAMPGFCRLFDLPPLVLPDAALEALGAAMVDANPEDLLGDSAIPAGFTYFGQFVDHDITREEIDPDTGELKQGRTPALDLDSLYLGGPADAPQLYAADGLHMLIGQTTPVGPFPALPNDLPRVPMGQPDQRKAIIGDDRNDENLAVAQTHLAFLKFHNAVVDWLAAGNGPAGGPPDTRSPFERARDYVTWHYQWIVLYDWIARIVHPEILRKILTNGRSFFHDSEGPPCMPFEFSVAAYRLGHSMIRQGYAWNQVFPNTAAGSLMLLFLFTGGGGMNNQPTLPSNWIVDWTRLHDFTGHPQIGNPRGLNFARRIDTAAVPALHQLPMFPPPENDLAIRNLKRGVERELPSGQAVAGALGIAPIAPAVLADGPHGPILTAHGMHEETPLWYYVLREAEILDRGQHLGPVGSWIVGEVFVGLVANSRASFFKNGPDWKPFLPSAAPGHFTMADLLAFVDDIDPLGNVGP